MILTVAKNSEVALVSQEDKGRYVAAIRSDGLQVFMDKSSDPISQWLNTARQTLDRKSVMLAVGMARGLQIALNYAEKYGNDEERTLVAEQVDNLIHKTILAQPILIEKV